jgi:hypothetical protein
MRDGQAVHIVDPYRSAAVYEKAPVALSYWRKLSAEAFRGEVLAEIATVATTLSSMSPTWKKAAAGDAGLASALALRIVTPGKTGLEVDLVMTVLLVCALENAGAALVLSHVLSTAPIEAELRGSLASSWLEHNARRSRRPGGGRRSIARRLTDGELA